MSWLRRGETAITPQSAGWNYCGMEIFDFAKNKSYTIKMDQKEGVLLSLSAENIEITINNEKFKLQGRTGVFAGISDWMYIPVDSDLTISAASGLVALTTAASSKLYPIAYKDKSQVSIEIRGSGLATRQVNNIATADSFTQADRILVCEVLTPGGNWSSWPPHRHDGIAGCEFTNEEIYYFQIGTNQSDHGVDTGHGFFKVYSYDGLIDETMTIKDRDLVIVPHGYHGPSIAAPEYPMYFLNVLAGPSGKRSMGFCDDPNHHWIRDSWKDQKQDSRCPMTTINGRNTR